MADLVRLQVLLTQKQLRDLDDLQTRCGFSTRKEMLINALSLLDWALREKQNGACIFSINRQDKSYKELLMPFFAALRESNEAPHPVPERVDQLVGS